MHGHRLSGKKEVLTFCDDFTTLSPQIIERCGKFNAIAPPGLTLLMPCLDVPSSPI